MTKQNRLSTAENIESENMHLGGPSGEWQKGPVPQSIGKVIDILFKTRDFEELSAEWPQ